MKKIVVGFLVSIIILLSTNFVYAEPDYVNDVTAQTRSRTS